jgi:hypothetical protein
LKVGTPDAFPLAALQIKITDAAIKITFITMDLDGEEFFPFNFIFHG